MKALPGTKYKLPITQNKYKEKLTKKAEEHSFFNGFQQNNHQYKITKKPSLKSLFITLNYSMKFIIKLKKSLHKIDNEITNNKKSYLRKYNRLLSPSRH